MFPHSLNLFVRKCEKQSIAYTWVYANCIGSVYVYMTCDVRSCPQFKCWHLAFMKYSVTLSIHKNLCCWDDAYCVVCVSNKWWRTCRSRNKLFQFQDVSQWKKRNFQLSLNMSIFRISSFCKTCSSSIPWIRWDCHLHKKHQLVRLHLGGLFYSMNGRLKVMKEGCSLSCALCFLRIFTNIKLHNVKSIWKM